MSSVSKRYAVGMFLSAVLLAAFGCGGGGGGGATQLTPAANTISGKTSFNAAGLAGVTVTIAGPSSGAATTDAGGNFKTAALQNGDYTVTPSLTGYSFNPASQVITVASGSVSAPQFTATAAATSFTVSGNVSLGGSGLAGATVTIAGAGSGSTTTDAGGNYSFSGVHNGNCTVTAALAGYTFTPISQAITVVNGDVIVPQFTASALASTFTISGRVTLNGTGLAGVTVSITGTGFGSLTTDASGNYSFVGVRNGDYTIIPLLSGNTFTPSGRTVTVSNQNMTGQDFVATPAGGGSIVISF